MPFTWLNQNRLQDVGARRSFCFLYGRSPLGTAVHGSESSPIGMQSLWFISLPGFASFLLSSSTPCSSHTLQGHLARHLAESVLCRGLSFSWCSPSPGQVNKQTVSSGFLFKYHPSETTGRMCPAGPCPWHCEGQKLSMDFWQRVFHTQ